MTHPAMTNIDLARRITRTRSMLQGAARAAWLPYNDAKTKRDAEELTARGMAEADRACVELVRQIGAEAEERPYKGDVYWRMALRGIEMAEADATAAWRILDNAEADWYERQGATEVGLLDRRPM